jgi:hypothetical protein
VIDCNEVKTQRVLSESVVSKKGLETVISSGTGESA